MANRSVSYFFVDKIVVSLTDLCCFSVRNSHRREIAFDDTMTPNLDHSTDIGALVYHYSVVRLARKVLKLVHAEDLLGVKLNKSKSAVCSFTFILPIAGGGLGQL